MRAQRIDTGMTASGAASNEPSGGDGPANTNRISLPLHPGYHDGDVHRCRSIADRQT
jgi:hypothetical protein